MHTETEVAVAAGAERAWAFLWDLERVIRCLPGCRDVRTIVPHERYAAVVAQRIGPFSLEVPMEIQVLEADAPRRLKAQALGRDPQTGSSLSVVFEMRLDGTPTGLRLVVTSETEVRGAMGALAEGLLREKAGGAMAQFADAVRREMEAAG
jgi:uncharacterized protein